MHIEVKIYTYLKDLSFYTSLSKLTISCVILRILTEMKVHEPITCEEIQTASRRLNSNKACSSDTILNEYLKEGIDTLLHPLEILFNYILNKKVFRNNGLAGLLNLFIRKGIQMCLVITGGLLL